jgi:hypothetical protein
MSTAKKLNIVGEIIEVKERQRHLVSLYDVRGKVNTSHLVRIGRRRT